MFTPVRFRLPFPTDREAPQVACCDSSKKYSSRQPSALGRYPAKSLASVRKCTPKRRSGQAASSFGEILCEKPLQPLEMYPEKVQLQTAFGFWSILCKKSRQRPEIYPEKTLRPDGLRLLVNPFRKISPATHCDDSKKYNSRRPSAFGQSPTKVPANLRRCIPKKRSGQTAFGF